MPVSSSSIVEVDKPPGGANVVIFGTNWPNTSRPQTTSRPGPGIVLSAMPFLSMLRGFMEVLGPSGCVYRITLS